MAKGQKRSNREPKKPKAAKTVVVPPSSLLQTRPVKPLPSKGQNK